MTDNSKPEPQAKEEPEDDLTIAYMCGVEKGKDYMREAIAKKDAALQACVEAMLAGAKIIRNMGLGLTTLNHQERDPESGLNQLRAAITQAQEALK